MVSQTRNSFLIYRKYFPKTQKIRSCFTETQSGAGNPNIMVSTPYPMGQQQIPGLPYSPISRNLGERTQLQQTQPFTQPQDIKYSPKHTGLYLYLVRLLRPIWKKKCIVSTDGISSLTHENCSEILSELYALKAFLDETPLNSFSGNDLQKHLLSNRTFEHSLIQFECFFQQKCPQQM